MAQSKGTIYLSVEKYVRERWGDDAVAQCLEELTGDGREVLDEVLAVGWYPIEPVIEFHRIVDRRFGRGDLSLVESIGRYSAEWQLNAFHKLVLRFKRPEYIVDKAGQLWNRYHETGRWEVDKLDASTIVGRLHDFAVADECFCARERGWFARALELTGGTEVVVEEPRCRARGAPYCEYVGTFTL